MSLGVCHNGVCSMKFKNMPSGLDILLIKLSCSKGKREMQRLCWNHKVDLGVKGPIFFLFTLGVWPSKLFTIFGMPVTNVSGFPMYHCTRVKSSLHIGWDTQ